MFLRETLDLVGTDPRGPFRGRHEFVRGGYGRPLQVLRERSSSIEVLDLGEPGRRGGGCRLMACMGTLHGEKGTHRGRLAWAEDVIEKIGVAACVVESGQGHAAL